MARPRQVGLNKSTPKQAAALASRLPGRRLSPRGARWNPERQAAEFGVEIGEYRGEVRVPRRVFQRLLLETPTPERCIKAYYLQRTRFEGIAERKIRRRQLTEDGNVEISGRGLRQVRGAGYRLQEPRSTLPSPQIDKSYASGVSRR